MAETTLVFLAAPSVFGIVFWLVMHPISQRRGSNSNL